MKRLAAVLFVLLLGVSAAKAQEKNDSGLKVRTPEDAAREQQAEKLITIDARVTDSAGASVADLALKDFSLTDGSAPREIQSLRYVDGRSDTPPASVILVLDAMNATYQDVLLEREGIGVYLRRNGGKLELPVTMVFLTDLGVRVWGPSQDGNRLAAILDKVPTPQRVLDQAQGAYGALDRGRRSLLGLQKLAGSQASLPGRKIAVWVGSGWPVLAQSTNNLTDREHRVYFDTIVEVSTDLRRAHITLSNVQPLNLAANTVQFPFLYKNYLGKIEEARDADLPNLSLGVVAIHSGGLVLSGSGELAPEIARCVSDAFGYYELTFEAAADNGAKQFRYHALTLKTDRPGLTLRTTSSYYAGTPQSTGGSLLAPVLKP